MKIKSVQSRHKSLRNIEEQGHRINPRRPLPDWDIHSEAKMANDQRACSKKKRKTCDGDKRQPGTTQDAKKRGKVAKLQAQLASARILGKSSRQRNKELRALLHEAQQQVNQGTDALFEERMTRMRLQIGMQRHEEVGQELLLENACLKQRVVDLVVAREQTLQQVQKLQQEKADALQREQQLQRQLEEEMLCGICMGDKKDTVLLPCMHFLYCHGCIQKHMTQAAQEAARRRAGAGAQPPLSQCPACRGVITGHLVAHLAAR